MKTGEVETVHLEQRRLCRDLIATFQCFQHHSLKFLVDLDAKEFQKTFCYEFSYQSMAPLISKTDVIEQWG